jgi:hypothetical protein
MSKSARKESQENLAKNGSRKSVARDVSRKEPARNDSQKESDRNDSQKNLAQHDSQKNLDRINSLRGLSNRELLTRLEKLHGTEREVQLNILFHLIEIDRRRLYLKMAYSSLFEFCTGHLNYSKSAAGRRISAARCIGRFPRVAELFRSGELNLCAVSMIAGILTRENAAEVLSWVRGRPFKDVELLVAGHRPEGLVRDRVRPVFVMTAQGGAGCEASVASTPNIGSGKFGNDHKNRIIFSGTGETEHILGAGENTLTPDAVEQRFSCGSRETRCAPGTEEPERVVLTQKFKLEFAVKPSFMKKLHRILSLLSTKHPEGLGLEGAFDILMEDYLDHHCPGEEDAETE